MGTFLFGLARDTIWPTFEGMHTSTVLLPKKCWGEDLERGSRYTTADVESPSTREVT